MDRNDTIWNAMAVLLREVYDGTDADLEVTPGAMKAKAEAPDSTPASWTATEGSTTTETTSATTPETTLEVAPEVSERPLDELASLGVWAAVLAQNGRNRSSKAETVVVDEAAAVA